MVKLISKGPVLYWSDRVGRYNEIFRMPKFRTMRVDTPAVATHLMKNHDVYLTPIGSFLRMFSLLEPGKGFTNLFRGSRVSLALLSLLGEGKGGQGSEKEKEISMFQIGSKVQCCLTTVLFCCTVLCR